MSSRLDARTEGLLASYVADINSMGNEAAKTGRFIALCTALFPGEAGMVSKLSGGLEKAVKITRPGREKTGFIDSYYGNAVIEFETSLRATGAHAEEQLREYCSGVWREEGKPYRRLLAIASDGIVWRLYRPALPEELRPQPKPDNVALAPLREFTVTEANLADFHIFLNGLLFRSGQIEPTATQFELDFGRTSPAYVESIEALKKAWSKVRMQSEPGVAFENWQKYLTVTYGSLATPAQGETEITDLELLFLKHTYLNSLAHLMIWALLSKGKTSNSYSEVAEAVLSGQYFESKKLANLVEQDFFQWVRYAKAKAALAPTWEGVIAQIETYDLTRLNQDVLKGVYQELVDPVDRHELGEYYTPSWLAEKIVDELIPRSGFPTILDPSCGSGTFLRTAVVHLLRNNPKSDDTLQHILESVVGIDVHPLAVNIAKANYVLALGDLVQAAKHPIQIPVYLADSLFLPAEVTQYKLHGAPSFEMRFGGKKVLVPDTLISSADIFDQSIGCATQVALSHADDKSESLETLSAYVLKAVPLITSLSDLDDILLALWQFADNLADLIRKKKNSIWAFIARNSYRPAMLRRKFDFIVGNPPWLSYRYITDPEYQEEIKKRAVEDYAIAPNQQRLMTQMELATVFVCHSMGWFGAKNARLGFVMPRSILSADQHENLRLRKYTWKAGFRICAYWDLLDVRPVFNVPSCVLFTEKNDDKGSYEDLVPAKEWAGVLPDRDLPWIEASGYLNVVQKQARVIFLAKRSALTPVPGNIHPSQPGYYRSQFENGATIYPRSFFFVRAKGLDGTPDPDSEYWIETDPEQAEDAKAPYKDIHMSGSVEGRFLFGSVVAKHVLPFSVLTPATVVLPVFSADDRFTMTNVEELKAKGYRKCAAWMKRVERTWKEKRGKKSENEDIYGWLNWQNKLTDQHLSHEYLVLYAASGTNAVAARFDRADFDTPLIVDHKLYWATFKTKTECDYITSLLNSSTANELIKPFQSMGLLGERDIHMKILDLRFPKYDPSQPADSGEADHSFRTDGDHCSE
jgi:type I restriction-modification system DNA methylase subunit